MLMDTYKSINEQLRRAIRKRNELYKTVSNMEGYSEKKEALFIMIDDVTRAIFELQRLLDSIDKVVAKQNEMRK